MRTKTDEGKKAKKRTTTLRNDTKFKLQQLKQDVFKKTTTKHY